MNTKTINISNEQITVTQYAKDDYCIAFRVGDFSVRGSMLDVIKTFADWQCGELETPVVSFDFDGVEISNPWSEETGRFPLTSAQAAEAYGLDNLLSFIFDACDLLRPDN